jgi:hypothetical protein
MGLLPRFGSVVVLFQAQLKALETLELLDESLP